MSALLDSIEIWLSNTKNFYGTVAALVLVIIVITEYICPVIKLIVEHIQSKHEADNED